MNRPLHKIFYVSRCHSDSISLDDILETSSRRNAESSLTGVLLFTGNCFAQVLEGSYESIAATIGRIQGDPRHTAVRILGDQPIRQRSFSHWSMKLIDVHGADELMADLLDEPRVSLDRAQQLLTMMTRAATGQVGETLVAGQARFSLA